MTFDERVVDRAVFDDNIEHVDYERVLAGLVNHLSDASSYTTLRISYYSLFSNTFEQMLHGNGPRSFCILEVRMPASGECAILKWSSSNQQRYGTELTCYAS